MISFTGITTLKQYVPNILNPVGLKNFALATPPGIELDFAIYQGKNTYQSYECTEKIGKGGAAIHYLSESLLKGTKIKCDRYFTGFALIDLMLKRDIHITGKLMKNHVMDAGKCITDDKTLVMFETWFN